MNCSCYLSNTRFRQASPEMLKSCDGKRTIGEEDAKTGESPVTGVLCFNTSGNEKKLIIGQILF
jgi:hypothetical protein